MNNLYCRSSRSKPARKNAHCRKRSIAWLFCFCFLGLKAASLSQVSIGQTLPVVDEAPLLAIPPIIRPLEVNLDLLSVVPTDFTLARQLPDSLGRRELAYTSPSTGIEQTYRATLPNEAQFELYEIEYKNLNQLDLDGLRGASRFVATQEDLEKVLDSFKLTFSQGQLQEISLANGQRATFFQGKATIRDAAGHIIETVDVAQSTKAGSWLTARQTKANHASLSNATGIESDSLARSLLAKGSNCQSQVNDVLETINRDLKADSKKLLTGASDLTKLFGWALAFSGDSMVSNVHSRRSDLRPILCQKPLECDYGKVTGGFEISHLLFKLPAGQRHRLAIEYEFYTIPDRIEVYSDGNRIFDDGPKSGHYIARDILLNENTNSTGYVGVNLIGNPENPGTEWWYQLTCESS